MPILNVRNVHDALPKALVLMITEGIRKPSRNGEVCVHPHPVTTLYERPCERVLFWAERDANPFFHFIEGLWMLNGNEDVSIPAYYASQIKNYSDDGATLAGAYGHRWRIAFDYDQINWIIESFKVDPNDRRVVLAMWDPNYDIWQKKERNSKDIPCNTHAYFRIETINDLPKLCMQVNCRSNDILWGAYGANAVHFSMLQEYLARSIGVGVGWMAQNSFNWHMYIDFWEKMFARPANEEGRGLLENMENPIGWNPYKRLLNCNISPTPMIDSYDDLDAWNEKLGGFIGDNIEEHLSTLKTSNGWFGAVAIPIRDAYQAYKEKNYDEANRIIQDCQATDWRLACQEWLQRRRVQRENKE